MTILELGITATYTQHSYESDSTRHRHLTNWSLHEEPLLDGNVCYSLQGQVVKEADGYEPPARFTTTSPIAKWEGSTVTTVTGSRYELQVSKDKSFVFRPEYCNPWIVGDNWKTIK